MCEVKIFVTQTLRMHHVKSPVSWGGFGIISDILLLLSSPPLSNYTAYFLSLHNIRLQTLNMKLNSSSISAMCGIHPGAPKGIMVNEVVRYRGRISLCWSSCVVSHQSHCVPAIWSKKMRMNENEILEEVFYSDWQKKGNLFLSFFIQICFAVKDAQKNNRKRLSLSPAYNQCWKVWTFCTHEALIHGHAIMLQYTLDSD